VKRDTLMEIAISGWELAEPHFLVEELTDRVPFLEVHANGCSALAFEK